MRSRTWVAALAATVSTIVNTNISAAQDRPAQQAGATVTVTGCLQRPQSAGSQAGTPTGTPASPSQADYRANSTVPDPGFILAGAREAGGTRAADGTRGSREQPMTYALVAKDDQLSPHVGHTVEITGVVAPPVAAKAPTNTPDPVPSPSAAADPVGTAFQTGVRQLRVTTIKMTAATCAQQP